MLITNFKKGGQYLIPVLLAIVIVIFQKVYINLVSKLFMAIGYLKHFDDDSKQMLKGKPLKMTKRLVNFILT